MASNMRKFLFVGPHRTIPERLPKRRAMTIALGIIATDGIVFAADRQASAGPLKNEAFKLGFVIRANPHGTMIVSGAGHGPYAEAARADMQKYFGDASEAGYRKIGEEIEARHVKFYKEKVLPLASLPSDERPDYDLLIGYSDLSWQRLWTTSGLVVNHEHGFAAIGCGGITASAILKQALSQSSCLGSCKLGRLRYS
jgi:hypothetical protein